MTDGGYRWYVLQCEVGREAAVRDCLVLGRVEVFLPLEKYRVRNGRKCGKVTRRRALFPGYLFLFQTAGQFIHAADLPFAQGYIRNAEGAPIPVRPGDVEALRALHAAVDGLEVGWTAIRTEDGETRIVRGLYRARNSLRIKYSLDANH